MSGKAATAQEFDSVTVFFSDIANYTVLASKTSVILLLISYI